MAHNSETIASELHALVDETEAREVRGSRFQRKYLFGGLIAASAIAAFAQVWQRSHKCVPATLAEGVKELVSLSEAVPEDGWDADEEDDKTVVDWISAANAASVLGESSPADANQVQSMMQETDPKKVQAIVKEAMSRNVEKTRARRRELKKHVKGKNILKKFRTTTKAPSNTMEIKTATCVFDVLSATTSAVSAAANINDVTKTCEHVKMNELFFSKKKGPNRVHAKICAINLISVLGNLVSLATGLALAADSCATTVIPNVDAKCSAAVTGLVTATAALAGGATLISGACRGKGWYNDIPAGLAPSNVGSNENYDTALETRRLEESSAPARQLLFGGGKGSTATHCATEIASAMWNLASFAFAINEMGNQEQSRSCPPTDLFGKSNKHGLGYEISQGFCTIDVTASITAILQLAVVLQLIAVNCLDVLNIPAICGGGIVALFAGASGIAQAAAGISMACDTFQKQPLKKIINLARGIDQRTGLVTDLMTGGGGAGGVSFDLGRRLQAAWQDEDIQKLKERFATPEDAFKSLGIDISNSTFWTDRLEQRKRSINNNFVNLVSEAADDQERLSHFSSASPGCEV